MIGFKITFPNKNYDIFKEIHKPWLHEVTDKITDKESQILNLLMMNPECTTSVMAEKIGVSRKNISLRLRNLKKKELLNLEVQIGMVATILLNKSYE